MNNIAQTYKEQGIAAAKELAVSMGFDEKSFNELLDTMKRQGQNDKQNYGNARHDDMIYAGWC